MFRCGVLCRRRFHAFDECAHGGRHLRGRRRAAEIAGMERGIGGDGFDRGHHALRGVELAEMFERERGGEVAQDIGVQIGRDDGVERGAVTGAKLKASLTSVHKWRDVPTAFGMQNAAFDGAILTILSPPSGLRLIPRRISEIG
jgi:tetrahydromethanopterin S-methyltransferase subunit G